MSALFPRWTNTLFRVVLVVLVSTVGLALGGLMLYVRSPLNTGQYRPVSQPIQFDHRHHTKDVGIDCRYCHSTVESSPSAGLPSTATCMGCHAQVWNQSPLLEPVRAAFFADRSIAWNRVHKLPEFVYFNHAIHVNKGVGCVSCHGRVDEMAAVEQVSPLNMGWCLECHRNPAPNIRPKDAVTQMDWTPGARTTEQVSALLAENDVHTRTSCTTCHR